jgi:hypothetical protein
MTLAWTALHLMSSPVAMSAPALRKAPNPGPRGAIQPGSVSDAVLKRLRLHPLRWHRTAEIVRAVGRSQKTVSWSLHYLRTLDHIDAVPCGGPSTPCRYLKYRAKQELPPYRKCKVDSDNFSGRGKKPPETTITPSVPATTGDPD